MKRAALLLVMAVTTASPARAGQTVEPEWVDMVTPEGRRFRMVLDQWQVCAERRALRATTSIIGPEAKDASAPVKEAFARP